MKTLITITLTLALCLLLVPLPASAQITCFGCTQGTGGVSVPNVTAVCAGTSSSCAVDIHTLNLTDWNPALAQCEYYTTASPAVRTPMTRLSVAITGSSPISSATISYSSPGNSALSVGCKVSSNGGAGPAGSTGSTGAAGAAATIAVGTVTTGAAGSSATVTNSGSSSAAVFDMAIPRGATGAAGSNGTNGSAGATGSTGPAGATGSPGAAGSGNNTLCLDATGSTTAYTCATPSPTVTTLAGLIVTLVPQTTSGGTATLNVASLGIKTLMLEDGSTAVPAGNLVGGQGYMFQYDGANFRKTSSSLGPCAWDGTSFKCAGSGAGLLTLSTGTVSDPGGSGLARVGVDPSAGLTCVKSGGASCAPSGGIVPSIITTYATAPSCTSGIAGQMFLVPTGAGIFGQCNGSTTAWFYNHFAVTPPGAKGSWTVKQADTGVGNPDGSITISASGTTAYNALVKSGLSATSVTFAYTEQVFVESGEASCVVIAGTAANVWGWGNASYTGASFPDQPDVVTILSDYSARGGAAFTDLSQGATNNGLIQAKIFLSGGSMHFARSSDGLHWIEPPGSAQVDASSVITSVGFGCSQVTTGTNPAMMTVYSVVAQ